MSYDLTHPTLDRIYTTNENVKGMLACLKEIMNPKGYVELYQEYQEITQKMPENETLSKVEKMYPFFGVDSRYSLLDDELTKFNKKLSSLNLYKELSDCFNDIKSDTPDIFHQNTTAVVDEYIEKNKKLMEIIIDVKNDSNLPQFTRLMNQAIETLFNSLKILSYVGRNDLLNSLQQMKSEYLREHLGAKIRKTLDTTKYKGMLDEDYVDESTIYECALQDKKIISCEKEVRKSKEKQAKIKKELEELKSELKEQLEEIDQKIQKQVNYLSQLKLNRKGIVAKKVLFNLTIVPLIAIPLSCPFIGHKIGKSLSSKVLLTKTYTTTTDMDSGSIIDSSESFEELNTTYIASVTIFEPWEKNISGTSYSRDGTVYDYTIPREEFSENDFHLTLDTIKEENLVKKYSYQQTTPVIETPKYLTEKQIYVTETYQDQNETIPSTKYNIPYTVGGVGVGIILLTSEVLAHYLGVGEWIENQKRKMQKELEENKEEEKSTNKSLKLALKNKKKAQQSYNQLTRIIK